MYAAELEKCTKKINKLISRDVFYDKNIYLFGVSDNTRQIIRILRMNGYEPIGVVDNDKSKQGSYCSGIRVIQVEQVEYNIKNVWLMYSFYWREMRLQLIESGVRPEQIYPLFQKEKLIWGHLAGCLRGKYLYEKFLSKYGNVTIFLCPYTGTGDIYLIGTFWEEYIERNRINNYVFIVISGACKKVAALFGIKNIVLLDKQKDAGKLISYYNLCQEKVNIKILNDAWAQINDNSSEWFRGYKGLYFTELFRKWVFDLPDESKPHHPYLADKNDEIETIFKNNKLKKETTVVLSPYSNTLADLPRFFWEEICDGLMKRGYTICTNSSGADEPAIKGSIPIFFPLNIAPQFINYAGGFIGVRSGFCDIVSGTKAKKVILYDARDRFYNCSAYEYFNLKSMGLCDDAIEIEYTNEKYNDVIDIVLSQF